MEGLITRFLLLKGSAVTQALVEDLENEVKQLKAKNELLKKTSELTSCSTSLSDVIESQQRKIEILQLSKKVILIKHTFSSNLLIICSCIKYLCLR